MDGDCWLGADNGLVMSMLLVAITTTSTGARERRVIVTGTVRVIKTWDRLGNKKL